MQKLESIWQDVLLEGVSLIILPYGQITIEMSKRDNSIKPLIRVLESFE